MNNVKNNGVIIETNKNAEKDQNIQINAVYINIGS